MNADIGRMCRVVNSLIWVFRLLTFAFVAFRLVGWVVSFEDCTGRA
jgi:hypothetical protein